MISCCPLDEDIDRVPPPTAPPRRSYPQPPPQAGLFECEDTECNYLVMFFIIGVLILAASDAVRTK